MPINGALPALALLGDVVQSTRRKLGWTQRELSRRSGVPQSQISRLERRRMSDLRLTDVDRLLGPLGIRYRLVVDVPFVQDRLQADLVHARCSSHIERRLLADGWRVAREVEIGSDRSRGWIDILAWHPLRQELLVIEVKSEIHDIGSIERTLNWYEREAWTAAARIGWQARRVRVALLILQSEANDRKIAASKEVFATAFPRRADELANAIKGVGRLAEGRHLAMIDPRSHRQRWLRRTKQDGRRSPAPYRDYIDAVRILEQTSARTLKSPSKRR